MNDASDERLAIVLLDHGSRRTEANAQLDELAKRVAARRTEAILRTAHLEIAEPALSHAIADCVDSGATRIVVHPFFLSPGRHTTQDVPAQIAVARARHPDVEIVQSEPLALSDRLVDVVLERIDETID